MRVGERKTMHELKENSLIRNYLMISAVNDEPYADRKRRVLVDLNERNGTKYDIKSMDNWIRGARPTPKDVQSVCRLTICQYVFGGNSGSALFSVINN